MLPELKSTSAEVKEIATILGADPNDIKLGVAATETNVKKLKLDDYRVVYFATHGLVAGDLQSFLAKRAEPALALTFPDRPTELDDGLLTASEIGELKLNADWVILSACNTAAGAAIGAEALSGLARSFFFAGARSLVVSHWAVNSRPTVSLMTNMIKQSSANPGIPHAQALRIAILSWIGSAADDFDMHPRMWAPFVVVGEALRP